MKATIAVLPGDGIGPDVTRQAVRVLEAVADRFGHELSFAFGLIGGAAIDETGDPLPRETVSIAASAHAVLLGAVGGPRWDRPGAEVRPERGLLALRKALGVFANIRPVRVPDALAARSVVRPDIVQGVDLVVVRELTGGIYFGERRRGGRGEEAWASDECRYSTLEIERVTRRAAELAGRRRGRVASIDKANVLETSRLWRDTVSRVLGTEYPGLLLEHVLVDAAAMLLLQQPRRFDVLLTENLFGDILTDEASVLTGSIGCLPSASLGEPGRAGLYEPIHGSAPDLAGQDVANPAGAILSAAMLLRESLGLAEEARLVEQAVEQTWRAGLLPKDLGGAATTSAVGDAVVSAIEQAVAAGSG